jgi:hypothetical protein
MPYETHWKTEWTAQTVSHNTVVVDGSSQQPTGERNVMWPVDSAQNRILGKLERFEPQHKLVSAACDRAYEGLILKRTVQLHGNCIVDVFDVQPTRADRTAAPRRFDYVLHVDGVPVESSVTLAPREGPLGERCGYQYVEQRQGATIRAPGSLTFAAGEKRLRIWVVPADETPVEVIVAEGLTKAPDVKMPMLLLRRTGADARFVTVIEPVDARNPLRAVRFEGGGLVLERPTGSERVPVVNDGRQ